jgi:alginate O-acetyltransferase complex protein AlgI
MVFSSVDFLFLFLPVFLLIQYLLPYRNASFVLFSLLFYFVGEGWYTAIVVVSVIANFGFGILIENQTELRAKRLALGLSIAANLVALLFFKYAGFLAENLLAAEQGSWIMSIHLPLGISFYTFHAISYLVDIYRHDAKAERSFINLSLYMLMFPQLIAGPILRFHTIARQLQRRVVTTRHLYYGLVLFCLGLGQKVLLADTLAGIADPLFARWQGLSNASAWLAAVAYSLQIFFDFAGYSNMALGLGWMTGFTFPKNFDYPYISRSITDFWRRWHMSLSRWFRDYLYIPLGGNRYGELRTYRNLMIVFLLCGLWHGAAWTFILWGGYHGLLLVLERLGGERWLQRLPRAVQHAYTLLAIVVGWVLFRAENVAQAGSILQQMFVSSDIADAPVQEILTGEESVVLVAAALFSMPLSKLLRRWQARPSQQPWPRRVPKFSYTLGVALGFVVFGASALKIFTGAYSPFIYFRF